MSDLHDKYPRIISASAPILALVGDIGDPKSNAYKTFLKDMSILFEHVLVIAGNHEFYGKTLEATIQYIQTACCEAGSNVHFLNRSTIALNGILFIGATLWSDISITASQHLNCFRKIYERKDESSSLKLRRETYLDMHQLDLQFIQEQLHKNNDTPCVLITHYAPLLECNGEYSDTPQASGFATDLRSLYDSKNIKAHIYGHTHVNGTWIVNDIPIVCNCKGYYPGECKGTPFDSRKTIEM